MYSTSMMGPHVVAVGKDRISVAKSSSSGRSGTRVTYTGSPQSTYKPMTDAPPSLQIAVLINVAGAPTELPPSVLDAWEDNLIHDVPSSLGPRIPYPVQAEKSRSKNSLTPSLLELPCVSVDRGRSDLRSMLGEEVECAEGRMFANRISRAVRSALRANPFGGDSGFLRGGPSVTLHVESFGYA
ncbi:hypothetical protein JAAARDRAFT_62677 [Jaapia argillacea MUCL 33604]|uniref:Uncharacterized protein n=1 Tax=Jaapia argillacea MUCL 33604 TaxID=933084 RepID=A0A067PLE9_9AGAM|nr:hypothetical protein JAAARDRAFT_62677 [Jaapia argillacea MUCL 33604]